MTDRLIKLLNEVVAENDALRERIEALSAPDAPFRYIYYAGTTRGRADDIEEWLQAQDPALFRLERTDTYRVSGPGDVTVMKVSTEDRTLATLFKLTFAGVA